MSRHDIGKFAALPGGRYPPNRLCQGYPQTDPTSVCDVLVDPTKCKKVSKRKTREGIFSCLAKFLTNLPVLDLELAELDCQVHDGNGYDLRLPTEAQRGPETVVDEGPRHLDNLLKLLRLS